MSETRLADGSYDAFVLATETRDNGLVALTVTVTAGARRGDVVTVLASRDAVVAAFHASDPIALIGLPCTLHVEGGNPRLTRD